MRPIFCFIDDSRFELEVFAEAIVTNMPGIDFILGENYAEIRSELSGRYPFLFILDLYGRDQALSADGPPPYEDLARQAAGFKTLEDVYAGLADFPGDRVNEYLKRLFSLADNWNRLFLQASRRVGQTINFGLSNLAAARREFPTAAAVGHTRKAMIQDAVETLASGMDGLTLKPHGSTDEAIRRATVEAAPNLLNAWSEVVTHRFTYYLHDLMLLLVQSELTADVPHLKDPGKLSSQAQAILGPGDVDFLNRAAIWWSYTQKEPII